jgi:Cft2 family RNA processing exonuclease
MRRAPFVALILPILLAACASAIESPFTVFADPGKYEWHSCDQLLPELKRWEKREKELKLLMDRAKQGTGGAAISVVAYQGDYVMAREELKVIDATARAKKCKMPGDWQSDSVIR